MDGASVNGGNAEAPREDPNLESGGDAAVPTDTRDAGLGKTPPSAGGNADAQEVNGDLKGSVRKPGTPSPRRKLRRFKANSTGTLESDAEMPGTRGRKRKLSEIDDASSEDDTMEFNGFESQGLNEVQPGSHVLKKLIG